MVEFLKVEEEANAFADDLIRGRSLVLQAVEAQEKVFKEVEGHQYYGSEGFTGFGEDLERVAFRVGLVAAIRAKSVGTCGVMVTAGHSLYEENGVQIIEQDGSHLDPNWELICEMIVNSVDI